MTPGPVPLPQKVREILAEPMIHHRTPEFERVLKSVNSKLKKTFLTSQPVFMHASTGSGAMESSIVNTLNPGDKILSIVSGKFGERWREMAKRHGCEVISMDVPWGEAVSLEKLKTLLQNEKNLKAVLCQACETSTATNHPIQQIAKLIRTLTPDTLFLVDAITGVGAMDLKTDEWGLDAVVSGSQKAFMLPTGLSFITLSERAWAANSKVKNVSYYFDLRLEKKMSEKGETYFSSVVPYIRALDVVLDQLIDDQLNRTIRRCQLLADVTRRAGEKLGLQVFSKSPSDSVTALVLPATVNGAALNGANFRDDLESHYNITVMGGQDQLKGKIIRIGHLGDITNDDMVATFEALAELLQKPASEIEAIQQFVSRELSK